MIGKTVSHYKILEKLGEGGMGVVYKAEDTKLKRAVALKFLSPQAVGSEEEKARFVHEARSAAALDHSNICTVHEIGKAGDQTFIAMAYVEGQSLKEKIEAGPMKIDEAVDLAVQISEGLRKAHEKGIVHRDIKPANVMITQEGLAKIMDFGLAKSATRTLVTREGTTLGTVAYMSPEQARGEDVDHRTDIWSLGVVLYEMVTGRRPFKGDYEPAIVYSILNESPESITSIRTDAPKAVEQVIERMLAKDVGKRYQDIEELLRDLRSSLSPSLTSARHEKAIVVLPFEDISPSKDNEYFSDGLTEEIITDLSQVHALRVTSRSSAMALKGTGKTIKAIARELNVQYVLEGSVRKAGNNIRIVAQLIDAGSDAHLWAEKYSGTLDDVFDIQEKVSRSIVDALKLKLNPEEDRRIAERPIDNVQAYECYLKARQEMYRWTEEGLKRALEYFQAGLEIVGDNALLYGGIGSAHWWRFNIGTEVEEEHLREAEIYAKKVFELEPDSSDGHRLLGLVEVFKGDMKQALRHLKKALASNPYDAEALMFLAMWHFDSGKGSAGCVYLNRLLDVDPLTPMNHDMLVAYHIMDGRFSDALEACGKAYRLDPEFPVTRFLHALSLAYSRRLDEAYALFDCLAEDVPEIYLAQVGIFLKYALQNKKTKALESVTPGLKSKAKWDPEIGWMLAEGYALISKKDEALYWLEVAVNRGFINYPFLSEYDPLLENIRGEEKFSKLMDRVKREWEEFEA